MKTDVIGITALVLTGEQFVDAMRPSNKPILLQQLREVARAPFGVVIVLADIEDIVAGKLPTNVDGEKLVAAFEALRFKAQITRGTIRRVYCHAEDLPERLGSLIQKKTTDPFWRRRLGEGGR